MIEALRPHMLQALRFGAVGVLNTLAGLGTIYIAMLAGVAPVPANMIGYAIGLAVSYTLNRRYTFRGGRVEGSAVRFLITFAVAYAVNMALLLGAIDAMRVDPYLAQLIASVGYTVTFFLLSKFYVFTGAR
ncbi:MAG: GtrA family protein [Pseudomonadota bacterium]